jgi:uncharacterized membrane protein
VRVREFRSLAMELLWGTILLRPYVFVFLVVYLLGSSIQFGGRSSLIFLPIGYLIAFASEFSSIHWGFPYGDYYYIADTINRELWVFGVPFMDSLSYVFLSACSYSTAVFLLSPFVRGDSGFSVRDLGEDRGGWAPWVLGSVLMVLLDVVIDPVALQGHKWFLGQIYGYRSAGAYFGIPMSNFYGWLLVALVLVKVYQGLIDRWGKDSGVPRWKGARVAPLWGPVLYLAILLFNLAVTFAIGELSLGIASSFIVATLLVMGATITLVKVRHPVRPETESPLRRIPTGRVPLPHADSPDARPVNAEPDSTQSR